MRIVGLSILALVTVGLLYEASRIFWHELRTLRYTRRLDRWAEEVDKW